MDIFRKIMIGIVCIAFVGIGAGTVAVAGDAMKITGTVNDDGQLVDDSGQTYEISDSGAGPEALEYSGEKIEVEGMVQEAEGKKVIEINSFKPVE